MYKADSVPRTCSALLASPLRPPMKPHLPLIGVLCSICLFVWAATYYPGGTVDAANSEGYDWARNTISALFQPNALNGAPNPARYIAVPAVLMYCLSLGFVFAHIARKAPSKFHSKTIKIAGIGTMVYAFLAVTPMHDLMVSIALFFFVVAVSTILHGLYAERHWGLFALGLACIALPLGNAVMYYGDLLYGMLPIVQKAGTFACIGWLFALYYTELGARTSARVVA